MVFSAEREPWVTGVAGTLNCTRRVLFPEIPARSTFGREGAPVAQGRPGRGGYKQQLLVAPRVIRTPLCRRGSRLLAEIEHGSLHLLSFVSFRVPITALFGIRPGPRGVGDPEEAFPSGSPGAREPTPWARAGGQKEWHAPSRPWLRVEARGAG